MTEQNRKRMRHWNTPGHAHELTFSCYKAWQWSSAFSRVYNFGLVSDEFHAYVVMLNAQAQRIGVV
jgi:hypothetical protein